MELEINKVFREFDPDIRETVQKLRLIDDTFFTTVARSKSTVREMLCTILRDDDLIVEEAHTQYELPNLRGRGVRLDAHCVLGDGRRVNVEVQKADNDDHVRRVRYNASCITASCTDPGTRFEEVPDVCVVYISTFDIFGLGKMCYEERSMLVNDAGETDSVYGDALVENGYRAIYVNTKIQDAKLPKLTKLMELFMKEQADEEDFTYFPEICREISYYKNFEKGETDMCDIVEDYAKKYAEKYAEKYVEKARAEGMLDAIKLLLTKGTLTKQQIADTFSEPIERIEAIEAEMRAEAL